jgi:hypothetical protein
MEHGLITDGTLIEHEVSTVLASGLALTDVWPTHDGDGERSFVNFLVNVLRWRQELHAGCFATETRLAPQGIQGKQRSHT